MGPRSSQGRGGSPDDYRVTIDGVTVRFKEFSSGVRAIVEGQLADDRLNALKQRTLTLLERLDQSPWQIDG